MLISPDPSLLKSSLLGSLLLCSRKKAAGITLVYVNGANVPSVVPVDITDMSSYSYPASIIGQIRSYTYLYGEVSPVDPVAEKWSWIRNTDGTYGWDWVVGEQPDDSVSDLDGSLNFINGWNPRAYRFYGEASAGARRLKIQIDGPTWGVLCQYSHQAASGASPTDTELALVTPASYSEISISSQESVEVTPSDVPVLGEPSIAQFWPGYEAADFIWG